jgi:hypothetical protein
MKIPYSSHWTSLPPNSLCDIPAQDPSLAVRGHESHPSCRMFRLVHPWYPACTRFHTNGRPENEFLVLLDVDSSLSLQAKLFGLLLRESQGDFGDIIHLEGATSRKSHVEWLGKIGDEKTVGV